MYIMLSPLHEIKSIDAYLRIDHEFLMEYVLYQSGSWLIIIWLLTLIFQNKELFNSNEVCLSAFKDVSTILCHPKSHDSHVIRALSDVHKLLGLAKARLKSTSQGKEIMYSLLDESSFLCGE